MDPSNLLGPALNLALKVHTWTCEVLCGLKIISLVIYYYRVGDDKTKPLQKREATNSMFVCVN